MERSTRWLRTSISNLLRPHLRVTPSHGHVNSRGVVLDVCYHPPILDATILLVIAVLMLAFTTNYVDQERMLYHADEANYYNTTIGIAKHYHDSFAASPLRAAAELVRETWKSTYYDYSLIHTL